jgi:hypothetical protein
VPGRYFPDRTPCASGDHTICEIPLAVHRGMIFCSGWRHSSEYCGWLDTNLVVSGTANESSICRGDHPLNPIYRALPCLTT